MSSPTRTGRLVLRTTVLLLLPLSLSPAAHPAAADWTTRVAPRLLSVWTQAHTEEKTQSLIPAAPAGRPLPLARFDQQGRVQLDVRYDCAAAAPTVALSAAGLVVGASVHIPPLCVVEGWLPANALPELASLSGVASIDLPVYSRIIGPVTHSTALPQAAPSSAIDGAAISIAHVDQYIQTTGKNGAGVAIGVMSDDVTSLALIQSRGELPAHVAVLTPSGNPSPTPSTTDEGTMMLEEMYALAPGAKLMFCGPDTDVEYVDCLRQLIGAGASIVADDIEYPAEDMLSAGSLLAQSVQSLLTQNQNVALFSAAGNENESFWQGEYAPLHLSTPLTCGGQADDYAQSFSSSPYETLTLSETLSAPIYLQWADPFGANVSNFDLYVLDHNRNVLECIPGAQSTDVFDSDLSPAYPAGTYYFVIGTPNTELNGKFLKLIVYGDGAATFSDMTSGSIASPQKLLSAVATVGAGDGDDGIGNTIERYSATGPVLLQYPTPISLQAPVVVAPDGVYVDASGTHFPEGPSGLFWGTSAATPNAAAIAALLRGTFPTLNAATILGALKSGAVQLGVAAPNGVYGYGRVDAVGALQALAPPAISPITTITIAGGSSSHVPFTLSGTGKLTLSGTSDNTVLISLAASAQAWFAPASCGVSTDSCGLTITPAIGQVGVAHLRLSVVDGAARSATASVTVTVTPPALPTVRVASGGSQSVAAGTAPKSVTISLSGATRLTVSVSSSNSTLLPASAATLSAGCGASSLSCTLSLKPTPGQSGTATVTVTAEDPYGQSAQGTLSLSVAAAAISSGGGGGGGAFDSASLLLLGLIFLCRHASYACRGRARFPAPF